MSKITLLEGELNSLLYVAGKHDDEEKVLLHELESLEKKKLIKTKVSKNNSLNLSLTLDGSEFITFIHDERIGTFKCQ